MGSNGRLGALPRNRSQSTVSGEASRGRVYCQAPMALLRFHQASTRLSSPMAPLATRSRALAYTTELVRWLPTCSVRPVRFWASTSFRPSAARRTMGFSQ